MSVMEVAIVGVSIACTATLIVGGIRIVRSRKK